MLVETVPVKQKYLPVPQTYMRAMALFLILKNNQCPLLE